MCSLASRGITALIDASNSSSATVTVASLSTTLQLPTILITPMMDVDAPFTLWIRPSLVNALADYLIHNNWTMVYFVYDNDNGADKCKKRLTLCRFMTWFFSQFKYVANGY